jgi:hypothetical protein
MFKDTFSGGEATPTENDPVTPEIKKRLLEQGEWVMNYLKGVDFKELSNIIAGKSSVPGIGEPTALETESYRMAAQKEQARREVNESAKAKNKT